MLDYVELFAGAGGASLAAQRLGLTGIGIEMDPAACATRRQAGFETVCDDVTRISPADEAFPNVPGLIASPPCQSFSAAGNGSGRRDMDLVLEALRMWSWEGDFADARTPLILQPLRWIMTRARAGRNLTWIALEQVPACLPIWAGYASMLEGIGYFTAVGLVHAEQWGVPQTRTRAVLIAHYEHPVWLPAPTHSRYHSREPARLDPGVAKWVSMAEALGCDPGFEVVSNYGTGGIPENRGRRTGDQPAATVTSKIDRNWVYRTSTMPRATVRTMDQPAPTIAFGNDMKSAGWLRSNYSRGSSHTGTAAERGRAYRSLDEPASTITGRGGETWTEHPEEGSSRRRISVVEAGILQSFPADFPWAGKQTDRYRQVGNAYSPVLAQAVIREAL